MFVTLGLGNIAWVMVKFLSGKMTPWVLLVKLGFTWSFFLFSFFVSQEPIWRKILETNINHFLPFPQTVIFELHLHFVHNIEKLLKLCWKRQGFLPSLFFINVWESSVIHGSFTGRHNVHINICVHKDTGLLAHVHNFYIHMYPLHHHCWWPKGAHGYIHPSLPTHGESPGRLPKP